MHQIDRTDAGRSLVHAVEEIGSGFHATFEVIADWSHVVTHRLIGMHHICVKTGLRSSMKQHLFAALAEPTDYYKDVNFRQSDRDVVYERLDINTSGHKGG